MKNKKSTNQWKGITLTKKAYSQIENLINKNHNVEGIQINLKKSGCAGFRYYLSLVYFENKKNEEDFYFYKNKIVKIYVENKNMKLLDGTEIDFIEGDGINMSFKFNNPQVKESCGCGESFNIISKILPT